jgi:hypothetical protein
VARLVERPYSPVLRSADLTEVQVPWWVGAGFAWRSPSASRPAWTWSPSAAGSAAPIAAAFSSQPQQAKVLEHLASSDGHLTIAIRDDCDVEVTVYRLDRLYRTHTATPLGHQATGRGVRFAVVRINATEVSIVSL